LYLARDINLLMINLKMFLELIHIIELFNHKYKLIKQEKTMLNLHFKKILPNKEVNYLFY